MKKYLYIGTGGFVGAVLRFSIKGIPINKYQEIIPLNTLLINIAGCFLMGLFITITLEIWEISTYTRLGFSIGLLGAFTTFSTICKEMFSLIANGEMFFSILYGIISAVLGISAVFFGAVLARVIALKLTEKKADDSEDEFAISIFEEKVS